MAKNRPALSPTMTAGEFDNGYWYAGEIKKFAASIGIPSTSKLRKDELENAIKHFLNTGKVEIPTKRSLAKRGISDIEKGLSLDLPVAGYTSNKTTKDFIVREAQKIVPDLKKRSGARYRLNRWREEQLTNGVAITYRDLVEKYIELNHADEPFKRVPSGRYINFLSDFLKNEKGATREQGIEAWKKLKALDIPKTYEAWKDLKRK